MFLLFLFFLFSVGFACFAINQAKKIYGILFNHYFFYNVYWIVMLICAIFYMGYYENINSNVYFIFLIGLNTFNITPFFLKSRRKYDNPRILFINGKLVRFLEVMVIVTIIPMAYLNYKLLSAGVPLWKINNDFWGENRSGGTYIYNQYLQMVVSPILILLVGMTFYKLYNFKKKYSIIFTFSYTLCMVILYTLYTGGGRSETMILAFTIFFTWISEKNPIGNASLVQIKTKYLIFVAIIITIAIQIMNINRGHTESLIFNIIQGQTYFVPLFDAYLNTTDLTIDLTFGTSFFEGFFQLFNYPFRLLGFSFIDNTTNEIVQAPMYCPSIDTELNAGVTCYYYFIRDFGYLGVIIGPILLAAFYDILFRFLSRNTWYRTFYYCVVLSWCLNSSFYISKSVVMSIVYLIIIAHIGKIATFNRAYKKLN